MMAGIKQHFLIFLFLLIVFVPAVILSFFAVRAVNQEEMVQKRQLEDTLLLELDKTNTILNLTIDSIIQELRDSLPDADIKESRNLMEDWMNNQSLAGIPYILSEERSIIYPDIKSADPDEKKRADLFHWRYLNLFSNSESIPVYKNIAEEYKEDILDKDADTGVSEYKAERTEDETDGIEKYDSVFDEMIQQERAKQELPADMPYPSAGAPVSEAAEDDYGYEAESADKLMQKAAPVADEAAEIYPEISTDFNIKPKADYPAQKMMSSGINTGEADNLNKTEKELIIEENNLLSIKKTDSSKSKKAIELFESDSVLQEEIYSRAVEEGQQYLTRNLLPQIALAERTETPQTVIRSVYIESSKYFDEITGDSDYGIIPRTFDSTFILLFWEKKGDIISGCEINMDEFNRRLTEAAGNGENSFRYINIIDRSGTPLVNFEGIDSGKWRKPFVAKEISSLLPYWETAILLRNPEAVEKQIESSKYFMMLTVFILCALIFTGITAVYRFSSSRLKNVQQRVGFVTNVSHELKTPLTSIRMYSEMMAEGFQKDPAKIQKYSGYIASESQRLTRLINNVLDFAKLEKGTKRYNPERCNINEIVKKVIPVFKEDFEKNSFVFETDISKEALYADCDKEGIIQVLINLLSNVQKYSDDEKYIKISTLSEDSNILVNIEDRGKGIHKKYRKKIFRDFYRIDSSITSDSKGTGLGLAIAKKIMKQNSGDLVFSPVDRSRFSAGSIFSLVIPCAEKYDNTDNKNQESDI